MEIDRRTVLAAGAALAAAPALATTRGARRFPKGFLWGAATAAHQVEGNNVNSDCWWLENTRPSVFAEPSGDACNSFALWRTDMDLVQRMGLGAYRFSLEWARIEPEPGRFSIAMLDHYKGMIAGCRARGLEPFVTFNHFTTPRWFAARGGWMNAQGPELFARFCDRAARHLADGIGHATTLNEPNLAGVLGDILPAGLLDADKAMAEAAAKSLGVPLFLAGNALWVPDAAQVKAHLLAAHKAGRAAIKAVRGDLPVGVSLAMLDEQGGPDTLAPAMREKYYGDWLRAARGDEFVGVQNYERNVWSATGKLPPPANAVRNMMGGEVYAPSLAGAVRHAWDVARVPVYVTEHGVSATDDSVRARLIGDALAELHKAIGDGVPVKGYLHWSLLDNFEWVFGYKFKFGLHSVDPVTFKRTPKPSAAVLGRIARAHAV
ncbi:family 1 glycosylhydrolase [Sphingomonas sp. SUN039]|uniref:family 1 glycosylhydrolase n=1 Tax=Sphingomonas sp. SUN039 TaxID=2937787 RepID=UPI00216424F0|nr:family 1 glycosylhydrolase [Sphingomonas sp. SUN039]UVO54362.1 family 1 glycosylhydrolase [Sphingomonas sp. SUN039]